MKNVVKSVLFVLLFLLSVRGVYRVISWKDTTGGYLSSVQQLQHTGDDLIDVFFVGSSHCYAGVYPDFLWRDSGIAAFDLAISGQDKWSSYYTLKEGLKTQSPKVVFADIYGLLFEGYGVEGNKYRNLLSFGPTAENMALIEKTVGKEDRWMYFLRWPVVHTRYRELQKHDFVQYEPSVYGRGACFQWETGEGPYLEIARSCDKIGELSEDNVLWLDAMTALAKEEGFTLVFFAAPMYVNEEQQSIFNAAARYAEEREIDLIDFGKLSDETGLDSGRDFCDVMHCNAYGAAKITEYFRGYLTEHFELTDHRSKKEYELWDLSYRYYCRLEAEREYLAAESMDAYLARAMEDEDVTVILNLEGPWEEYSQELCRSLGILGICEKDYPRGGRWIYCNGENTFSMSSTDLQVYCLDLSDTDTLRLENRSEKYGESMAANVMINRTPYGRYFSGMTALIYDNFTGKVIGTRELN